MKNLEKFYMNKIIAMFITGILSLFIVCLLSILFGSIEISLKEIFFSPSDSSVYKIIHHLRIPRTLATILAGSGLAVSGAILQSVLNNPLASPGIIGVNSGAGLFTILIMILLPDKLELIPIASFIGAVLASFIVYIVAQKTGGSRITIILSGVAIGSLFSAGIDAFATLFPNEGISINSFMVGGFSSISTSSLTYSSWYLIVGLIISILLSFDLNILSLGEDSSKALGINVKIYRFIFIVIASVLAGASVSFAGLLGFVGLIVPHFVRIIVGHDNRFVIPFSALFGGVFVCGCDLLGRILFAPYEIPVGIIMSFIGAPFFFYLLFSKKRRGELCD